MTATRFKLLGESLGLGVREMSVLLNIPHGTAKHYASGHSPASPEILAQLETYIVRVEQAALAFRHKPENVRRCALQPGLHPAIHRRMLEMEVIQKHERLLKKASGK